MAGKPTVIVKFESEVSSPLPDLEKVGAVLGTSAGTITQIGTVPGATTTGLMIGTYAGTITLPARMKKGESNVLVVGLAIPSGRAATVSGTVNPDGTKNVTVVDTLAAPADAPKAFVFSDVASNVIREFYGDGVLTEAVEQALLQSGEESTIWAYKTADLATSLLSGVDTLIANASVKQLLPTKILFAGEATGTTAASLAAKQASLEAAQLNFVFLVQVAAATSGTLDVFVTATITNYAAARADGLQLFVDLKIITDGRGIRKTSGVASHFLGRKLANLPATEAGNVSIGANRVLELADMTTSDAVKILSDAQRATLDAAFFNVLFDLDGKGGYLLGNDQTRSTDEGKQSGAVVAQGYKLVRALRAKNRELLNTNFVRQAGGKISEASQKVIEAERQAIIDQAKADGEISSGTYIVTDVSTVGLMRDTLKFNPLGVFKNVRSTVLATFDV